MFFYEYLTTLFWFALGLTLLLMIASFQNQSVPTLRVYRYYQKLQIERTFWLWLMCAVLFYAMHQEDIFTGLIVQIIALLLPACGQRWAERGRKKLLDEEMQFVRGTLDTERLPIEESNLSTDSLRTTLVLSFAGMLLVTAWIASQLFRYLYHPEEYLIGGSMVAIMILAQLLFVFRSASRFFYDDFPEVTPENSDDLYWKLAELRDGKQDNKNFFTGLWVLPLFLLWVAALIFSFYAFYKTPFGTEVMSRIEARKWSRDSSLIGFRIVATGEPESQVKIAATWSRDTLWTFVFTPLGFAGDEAGCLLYSELLREAFSQQMQEEVEKPFVEPMLLAPDFLLIPFYVSVRHGKHNDTAPFLENIVFGNSLEEPTFDAAKTALLEKLRGEVANAEVCASKFALTARRQVVDFGNEHVALLADLENADPKNFQEYSRHRFSQYHLPLIVQSGEQSFGTALDEMERQLETLLLDTRRKPPPPAAPPGDYRATWDADFPAMVATWSLPDPKEFSDDHGNALLAVKAMERQLRAADVAEVVAVHSGSFAAPEGLVVFVSVVWNKETSANDMLALFDSATSKMIETSSLPDWLQTEREDIAISIAPYWKPGMREKFTGSSARAVWGASHFRYASLLTTKEEYRTLAKSVSYANFYSVVRAYEKWLTKEQRTLVMLTPL